MATKGKMMTKSNLISFYFFILKLIQCSYLIINKVSSQDYEECVALKDPECQYIEGERTPDTMYQLTDFFCGHDSHCE